MSLLQAGGLSDRISTYSVRTKTLIHMARWFILAGVLLIVIGLTVHFAPWLISWFGKLPGDIRYESGRSRIFIPLTSMILVSIILTILINLLKRVL